MIARIASESGCLRATARRTDVISADGSTGVNIGGSSRENAPGSPRRSAYLSPAVPGVAARGQARSPEGMGSGICSGVAVTRPGGLMCVRRSALAQRLVVLRRLRRLRRGHHTPVFPADLRLRGSAGNPGSWGSSRNRDGGAGRAAADRLRCRGMERVPDRFRFG
ncbi:hypothetical protein Aau02nite_63250 [Amorphoplanes auranticolor]|uniref:Uncharacterized protein n=1 Tax=Actinoplanes auranticolor TaxID=47988 RepID=A0A919VT63_9ACTN|nr:hypothetical protein Aau02nite_63250 [Actinoplanes auranticolor]